MKNIHILPTDKPSRIYSLNTYNGLRASKTERSKSDIHTPKNIYITSDEEIKKEDWYINNFVNEREQKPQTHTEKKQLINHQKDYRFKYCKKIILTTDQDLIKDGVQKIDDEFLEWFVKNPNCEEVEIENWSDDLDGEWKMKYKIIIPKEEHCTCKLGQPYNNICCKIHGNWDKDEEVQLSDYEKPKQKTFENMGKEVVDYCQQYKKTDKYNVAMLAIEFGYNLALKYEKNEK